MNIYLLCGFPGSGKTTWAKNYIEKNPNTLRVCKDDIRRMLFGDYKFLKEKEPIVSEIIRDILSDLIYEKYDVIIDETCIRKSIRLSYLQQVDSDYDDCDVTLVQLPRMDKETLLDRRMSNPHGYSREYWGDVLDGMFKGFEPIDEEERKLYKQIINV